MSEQSLDRKRYEAMRKLHHTQAEGDYHLEVFGDTIAKREGYQAVSGIEAVHFYLVQKFKWLPSQVRAMSYEDLRFVLCEEMSGWTLPKEALF